MPRTAKDTPWFGRRKGSPTFYAFWYDRATRETRRLSLGTKDPLEAKARFATFLSEGKAFTDPEVGGLTVSQALSQYWTDHVTQKCAAPRRQDNAIRKLVAFFGATPLAEVDIPLSRLYADQRRAQGTSDPTVRRELGVLIAAANHARRWKRIAAANMPSVELPKDSCISQDEETHFFTKEQVRQMFTETSGEFHHYLKLLYYSGARRNSIETLERSQVRWEQGHVLLTKPGQRITKKRRPIVPILNEMREPLKALYDAATDRGAERLFTMSSETYYCRFKALLAKIGLEGHPHLMRHSRATHLLQDGVPLYSVARLLGDTVATVERVYGHHSAEHLSRQLSGGNCGVQQLSSTI